jgi:hypothetical protein
VECVALPGGGRNSRYILNMASVALSAFLKRLSSKIVILFLAYMDSLDLDKNPLRNMDRPRPEYELIRVLTFSEAIMILGLRKFYLTW